MLFRFYGGGYEVVFITKLPLLEDMAYILSSNIMLSPTYLLFTKCLRSLVKGEVED